MENSVFYKGFRIDVMDFSAIAVNLPTPVQVEIFRTGVSCDDMELPNYKFSTVQEGLTAARNHIDTFLFTRC
ncbi:hypothetical protein ACFYKX_11070 [Cytobacillus sp. FJAT-54145]|uniref:Uncharacterized protein n=1 Tax=Cytobacillus spartinae TaxID=3299023 RepID=A0ABW6KD03_9BACI